MATTTKKSKPTTAAYDRHVQRVSARQRLQASIANEIGELPQIQNPERRERGRVSLESFCKEYMSGIFSLPFGQPHRAAISRLESCTSGGGLYALSFARGGGKSSLALASALRALLYGLRRFCVIVCATDKLAGKMLKKLQYLLETSDALLEDFPQAVAPIRALNRKHNRSKSQTYKGEPTRIEWVAEGITLPTIEGSPSSGATIHITGITSSVKGLSVAGPGGITQRPDLLLIDDVQNRKTAKSMTLTDELEATIQDDMLNLAGPDTAIAAVFLCTPIYVADLSERFLSHERHPEWGGQRTRMIEQWPIRMNLWDEYAGLWKESLRLGGKGEPAQQFYIEKRAAMDEGHILSWPELKYADEVSGLEHALRLYFRSPHGFHAEYNCEPELTAAEATCKEFLVPELMARVNQLPRYHVPQDCTMITTFIDLHLSALFYCTVGWNPYFGGAIVDWGAFPEQSRRTFTTNDVSPSLRDQYAGYKEDQIIYASLRDLVKILMAQQYVNIGSGHAMPITRIMIDSGYLPHAVYEFIQKSQHRSILYASKGYARSESSRGIMGWRPSPGTLVGDAWRLSRAEKGRPCPLVLFDPDTWKSSAHDMLTQPLGGNSSVSLWGDEQDMKRGTHELFADHLNSEYGVFKEMHGTKFFKWGNRAFGRDNHLLDCITGAACCASTLGLKFSADVGGPPVIKQAAKPMSLLELRKQNAGSTGQNYGHGRRRA